MSGATGRNEKTTPWRRKRTGSYKHSLADPRGWPNRPVGLPSPCCSTLCLSTSKLTPASSEQPSFSPKTPCAPSEHLWCHARQRLASNCTTSAPFARPRSSSLSGAHLGRSRRAECLASLRAGRCQPEGPYLTVPVRHGLKISHRKLPGWIRPQLRKMAMWGQLTVPLTQHPDIASVGRPSQRSWPALLPTLYLALANLQWSVLGSPD